MIENKLEVKPFLRWAGGKTWLNKFLKPMLDFDFNQYHEPFLGGGATYFFLQPNSKCYLSDLNPNLISTYISIKNEVSDVIKILKTFKNEEDFYYDLRNKNFQDTASQAAKFIYLNQTSFNGIYRVNLNGVYNVPYGYRSKDFLDESLLNSISNNIQQVEFETADFDIVKKNLCMGDLVFLDPPYTVSHNNNGFIKYNEKLFSLEDQYRLSDLISHINEKGAYFILTNAAHEKIKEIFGSSPYSIELTRANLIGGANAERGKTNELIFTNIKMLTKSMKAI